MKSLGKDEKFRAVACYGKHKHETFAAAKQQATKGKRTRKSLPKNLVISVYHCCYCGFYHVGNSKKHKKKKHEKQRLDI